MHEIDPGIVQQREEENRLRWFSDADHDLFVWASGSGLMTKFQFCYDKTSGREQVVYWELDGSIDHALVDDFRGRLGSPTPILVSNGLWDLREPLRRLRESREGIDARIYRQLMEVFEGYTLQVSI